MTDKQNRVAILLSTFNGEQFLSEQLDSLLAQTHADCDIWLRDDGSTDGTVAIVQRYAAQHPRIQLKEGHNLGFVASFYELLQMVGDDYGYFAFCDQDDVWGAGKVAAAVSALAAQPGVALYCSRTQYADTRLQPLGLSPNYQVGKIAWGNALVQNIATGCTVVLTAEARALMLIQKPKACLAHDWWAYLVVSAFGQVVFDPQSHILYRQHGGNTIGMERQGVLGQWARVQRFIKRLRKAGPGWLDQLDEFERIYGDQLDRPRRAQLQVLLQSRRSIWAALWAAGQGFFWRMSAVDTLILRVLLALRLY